MYFIMLVCFKKIFLYIISGKDVFFKIINFAVFLLKHFLE